ncbi:MAG: DUF4440 domain-containing protein [Pseudonocardia sp.]|nr:DUF4440 domain-containing protein [Pseudonocardia sp.]
MVADDDIAACVAGEMRLLDAAVRRGAGAASLFDDGFREFGSSGRVWDRASILVALAEDASDPPAVEDVVGAVLGLDVVLVTYRTVRPERSTLRSSIWRRRDGRWLLVFHQGTVVPP